MTQQHQSRPRDTGDEQSEVEDQQQGYEQDRGNAYAQEQLRARSADADDRAPFRLLGQSFATLQAVHDWLVDQAARPDSTVPREPVLRVTLAPGAVVRQRQQTDWTYYSPDQRLIIDGQGATVSGVRPGGRPTPGWFLSYRPVVQSTQTAPARANFELRGLTIKGYESGGVEISPRAGSTPDHDNDGGLAAWISGAVIEDNTFKRMGTEHTPTRETDYHGGRFGAAGVLMRGVSDSSIRDNDFTDLVNGDVRGTPTGPRLIHAIYARDRSSRNRIEGNRFQDISGDPIRVSNASDDNVITGNTARNAGLRTLVSEFYNSGPQRREADSEGNRVFGNRRGRAYGRRKRISRFHEKHVHTE